jgi:hypothetical protein
MSSSVSFILMLLLMMSLITGLLPYFGRQGLEFGIIVLDNEKTHLKLKRWKIIYFLLAMFSGMTIAFLLFILMKNEDIIQMERFLVMYVLVAISFINFII